MLLQKLVAEAEKCKAAGNDMFKQRNYEAAAVSAAPGFRVVSISQCLLKKTAR